MLKLSSSLYSRPIVSLRLGGRIGTAEEPIINPHNLKVLGWWCRARGDNKDHVLLVDDVRQFLADGLAIDDEDDLNPPEDLVRHQDTLEIDFKLLGKPVQTRRTKLGKVSDFSYNDGLFVQKLYVDKPLRKLLSSDDKLIIDRTQIIEVTDEYILVRDGEVKQGSEDFAGATAPA